MESKKGSTLTAIEFPQKVGYVKPRKYRVISTGIKAVDSGSPGSNFKIVTRLIHYLEAAKMPKSIVANSLPEGQDYEIEQREGVASLNSNDPSSGVRESESGVLSWETVPDTKNILAGGEEDSNILTFPSQAIGSERLNIIDLKPKRLPELDKAA